jgi:hypothetical protein
VHSERSLKSLAIATFLLSFALIVLELLITRLFGIVLFAQFAHLALALAMLGISVGAILQHLWPGLMPDEGLERRVAQLLLIQVGLTIIAVLCTVEFPVTVQFDEPPLTYQERSHVKDDLLDPMWFLALLPVLTAPFVTAGLVFAGIFHRRRKHIGFLYGADLIGGAVGAVVFIPALSVLAGPDVVFVCATALALGAALLFRVQGSNRAASMSGVLALGMFGLMVLGTTGNDLIQIRYSAGYSEDLVTHSEWTALTRVSVHEDERRGAYMLLDNSSASEVFQTEARRKEVAEGFANRSVVYQLHDPPAKVAILAASAGPEVAVAQYFGYTNIEAVDIAGEIFDIVAERFPDSPVNPYTHGETVRVKADGRAAILHAGEPYDIIHMVHANLWSSAGLLSGAWSPSLLETVEAFETYLNRLSEDGTIAFGRGSSTDAITRAAAEALRRRGVEEPWRHMAYAKPGTAMLLVKKRPFTQAERDKVSEIIKRYRPKAKLILDPMESPKTAKQKALLSGVLMTDDRPYLDDPSVVFGHIKNALSEAKGKSKRPLAVLYRSFVVQCVFVLSAGVLFLFVPFLRRGPMQLAGLKGVPKGLLYVAGLGYGYLSIETILVHELVLFVGHPTYAVTVVILSMLFFSGLGSVWVGRLPQETMQSLLPKAIVGVILLAAVQGFVIPDLLHGYALGLPLPARVVIIFVLLAPLGVIMGIPFPLAMRILRPDAGGIVPWAWALNGWMSVVASLVTVFVSRLWGYSVAYVLALCAYVLALSLAGSIAKIRKAETG